jgi:hypothetical protein
MRGEADHPPMRPDAGGGVHPSRKPPRTPSTPETKRMIRYAVVVLGAVAVFYLIYWAANFPCNLEPCG